MNPLLLDLAALYAYLNTAPPWTAAPDYTFITDAELQSQSIADFMADFDRGRREWERGRVAGQGRRRPGEEEIEGNPFGVIVPEEWVK